jgi:hypothetical protein
MNFQEFLNKITGLLKDKNKPIEEIQLRFIYGDKEVIVSGVTGVSNTIWIYLK